MAWESKAMRPRHTNKVLCMSVQQSSKSKVSVTPLNLEGTKEPPLNTYKPKEPYTATILSVERIVGPKAPGETCHIVIDHGGNVPYWEGQSFGVIPPVSFHPSKSFPLPEDTCISFAHTWFPLILLVNKQPNLLVDGVKYTILYT